MLARREDPRDFRRLHRDLIAISHLEERNGCEAVLLMAQCHSLRSGQAWWEKARRIRSSAAACPAVADDLDRSLERSLEFLKEVRPILRGAVGAGMSVGGALGLGNSQVSEPCRATS